MVTKYPILFCFLFFLTSAFYPLTGAQETKIKAIVFDFGGVFAKTDKQQVAEYVAKQLNISENEAKDVLLQAKEKTENDSMESDFWQNYSKTKEKKLPNDWLNQLNTARFQALKETPGMVDLVKELKKQGYQTALLSNVRKSSAQIKRKLGLYDLFHPTILSYESGYKKPDVKAYKLMLDKLNLPPQEVLFIDNRQVNIDAAKALGMDAILFENAEQLTQALKDRGIIVKPATSPAPLECRP